ncbi:hypothetical protein B0H14DRAFT_3657990 [Mycena olivaceomarginata]|nr:hypothetical protein B0H14DRAFT_3657990 [Mycena olivaceomarginata]
MTVESIGRTLHAQKRKSMGKGKVTATERDTEEQEQRREAEVFAQCRAAKHVDNMKLRNTVMQLCGTYSHPFLYAQPDDAKRSLGRALPTSEVLAICEAEMLLLDWPLGELFKHGHKNLLFSQFTTWLDIIEDWAIDMKGWRICHIDETTLPRPDERLPEPSNFHDSSASGAQHAQRRPRC